LTAGFERHLARYRAAPDQAVGLLQVGEAPPVSGVDAGELAAYATVANLILNLDEVVTKE
jgi:hypothetical protein